MQASGRSRTSVRLTEEEREKKKGEKSTRKKQEELEYIEQSQRKGVRLLGSVLQSCKHLHSHPNSSGLLLHNAVRYLSFPVCDIAQSLYESKIPYACTIKVLETEKQQSFSSFASCLCYIKTASPVLPLCKFLGFRQS